MDWRRLQGARHSNCARFAHGRRRRRDRIGCFHFCAALKHKMPLCARSTRRRSMVDLQNCKMCPPDDRSHTPRATPSVTIWAPDLRILVNAALATAVTHLTWFCRSGGQRFFFLPLLLLLKSFANYSSLLAFGCDLTCPFCRLELCDIIDCPFAYWGAVVRWLKWDSALRERWLARRSVVVGK